jgi:hypothetical protein
MPNWEYCYLAIPKSGVPTIAYLTTEELRREQTKGWAEDPNFLEKTMAELGMQGWEMYAIEEEPRIVWFKRQVAT